MPEFILFQGRIIRKDLVKSVYNSYNPINSKIQPTVEFIGETEPLFIGQPTDNVEESLEIIYSFYMALGGGVDDVIKCRNELEEESDNG